MSAAPYKELLLDPRWQKKRLQTLERDDWKCRDCGAGNVTLHVHHCYYDAGVEGPWDYPDHSLITLCADCHKAEEDRLNKIRPFLVGLLALRGFIRAQHLEWLFYSFMKGIDGSGEHMSGDPLSTDEVHSICLAIHAEIVRLRAK